ncbi:vacuolar alkaline phosphatase [Coemansia aciculifera]|uniref:Alkaline phosphatase n=1 Tax=Coemansia aciculifera TaxID=417176 RepID=A0A9W8M532_9FUNG|nr:vacuolar alkaline phosphatase [Coemansia aciculifera]KAJ2874144.1 vacuolar alkaline phosphatase [Coemansia aciculifera]
MPSPFYEKAMSQAKLPYTAVARTSQEMSNQHVRFAHEQHHSEAADIEESELFDMPARPTDTMEAADNDALYYAVSLGARRRTRKGRVFWVTVLSLVIVSVVGMIWLYFDGISWMQRSKKRNVILMISDGFGPASETMARNYVQQINDLPIGYKSPLDEILVGSSRTRSMNSLVTDSAAGATAFSCLIKTYNGAIAVADDKLPCGTVLEAAKLQRGMYTGLVATSRITHATPASFSAHVTHRDMEDLIAEYQIGNYSLGPVVDLMFGGGRCHFMPNTHANVSCRMDARDLWSEAQAAGFHTLSTRKQFDALDSHGAAKSLPILGAFAPSHMEYEIDRDATTQPSLAEMSAKALGILDAATKKKNAGFFLMIEGSRIDMAAHTNDPAAHLRDIIAYWDAISVVRKFVDEHPDTVLISVSDHETGGFSTAKQLTPEYPEYLWNPRALEHVRHSIEYISYKLLAQPTNDLEGRYKYVRDTVFADWMGIKDAKYAEVIAVAQETESIKLRQLLSDAISNRAQIGWATHGHSAVDVNLYAYGKDAHLLRGNKENTDIGKFIADQLGLDLGKISGKIKTDRVVQGTRAIKETWLGRRDLDALEHSPSTH